MRFVCVITAHRCLSLAKMCIGSIQAQLSPYPLSVIYVDDASHYTEVEIKQLQEMLNPINGQILLLQTRHYQIGSLSKAIPLIESSDAIICLIDGDDYLLPHALQTIASAYSNPNIVMTYGNVLLDFRPYQDTKQHYFSDKYFVNTEYPILPPIKEKAWFRR